MPNYANRYISTLTRETYALILAGGRGSRLHELTDWRAKPAVYFGVNIALSTSHCLTALILASDGLGSRPNISHTH